MCVLCWVDVWQSDGDGDRCDKCADVPVISDTPGSLRGEQGRGDGPCLINMGEIPSANKRNVRFLIRPTCLKAALALED